MLKKLKLAGILFGITYIATCLSLFSFQKKFIYKPLPHHPQHPTVEKIYNSNGKLLAMDFNQDNTQQTLIIFHGRDRNAGYRGYFSKIFGNNSRLLVIEYPGFGENYQQKISKKNILTHCHEAISHILTTVKGPITIVGESLGSGIAAEIAYYYNLPKLILITPYSKLSDIAQSKFWYLPTKALLKDNYDNINNLKNYLGEVLFIISEDDKLIPPKFGKKLLHSFDGKKEEIFVLAASHYDWWAKMNINQKNKFKQFYENF